MDIFKEAKIELLALTETKLKGKGVVSWSGVNVIFASVQEILLNDVWHSAVIKYGFVSSRIL